MLVPINFVELHKCQRHNPSHQRLPLHNMIEKGALCARHSLGKMSTGHTEPGLGFCPHFFLNCLPLCPVYCPNICQDPERRHVDPVNQNLSKSHLLSTKTFPKVTFHLENNISVLDLQCDLILFSIMRSSRSHSKSFSFSFSYQLGDCRLGERSRNKSIFKCKHPQRLPSGKIE